MMLYEIDSPANEHYPTYTFRRLWIKTKIHRNYKLPAVFYKSGNKTYWINNEFISEM